MDRTHPSGSLGNAPGLTLGRALQEGFTLIELMIVVAIIGILAAIAIPQYQIYTGRSQLTEALHLAESRKTAIAERLQFGVAMATINGGANGIPDNVSADAGRYVASLVILDGAIVATMRSANVAPCVLGTTVTIVPFPPMSQGDPISWSCATTSVCKPQTCS